MFEFVKHNTRPDGRALHAIRPTSIQTQILKRNTFGSAFVSLDSSTQVIAATSLLVCKPLPLAPNKGFVEISLNIGPVSHSKYNHSQRFISSSNNQFISPDLTYHESQKSIESWLTRTLLGSKSSSTSSQIIDLDSLCIEPSKFVFKIKISLQVINHDGNLQDACFLAMIAALRDTVLPDTQIYSDESGNEVVGLLDPDSNDGNTGIGQKLKMGCIPIPLTIGLFQYNKEKQNNKGIHHLNAMNYKMLADPTIKEENVLSGTISVVVGIPNVDVATTGEGQDDKQSKFSILSIHKAGGKAVMKPSDIAASIELCKGRALEIFPILKRI